METYPFNFSGYISALQEQKLLATRCADCGETFLPPREMCPKCYTTHMEWVPLSGQGELAGYTTINVGLPVLAALGYNRERPYCCGVIQLAEGPRICARLVGIDENCPEPVSVGMPLEAVFLSLGGPVTLAFQPRA